MSLFRVKTVEIKEFPGQIRLEVPISFGPLRADKRRVEIHQAYLQSIDPQRIHIVQEIRYD